MPGYDKYLHPRTVPQQTSASPFFYPAIRVVYFLPRGVQLFAIVLGHIICSND